MEALKDRNLTVHTYEKKIAIAVEKRIHEAYFPALATLFQSFSKKADQDEKPVLKPTRQYSVG